jgi:hypothetical protein
VKIGDYVSITGIVYEDGSNGDVRIQIANGTKVKYLKPDVLSPASPAEIKKFQGEAVEGMTPEAIIDRETKEAAEKENEEE